MAQGYAMRARTILNIVRNGPALVQEMIETRCHRGADIVRRLRLAEQAAEAVASLDEHWDGGGRPLGLKGEAIPFFSRIVLLAQVVEVFHPSTGREAAIAEVRRRSGSWFDPAIVNAFERAARDPALWAALDHGAEALVLAEADVDETFVIDDAYLDDVAMAFADVVDAKSPFTAGHSRRVASFADNIAASSGFDGEQRQRLRRAALLHDVGKLGISNMVLEKPGKLDEREWAVVREHPEKSEAILSRIAVFADAARVRHAPDHFVSTLGNFALG